MRLAAIDIGSNAIRFQVSNILEHNKDKLIFKRLEYVRFPLRLGQDVFTKGYITDEKKLKLIKLLKTFQLLIELYEVDDYEVCATSALRESTNGTEIVQEVFNEIGMPINVIDGESEANLINVAIKDFLKDGNFLHIDVGGGSTELNLYINSTKIVSKSFRIGSVRRLEQFDIPSSWVEAKEWVIDNVRKKYENVTAIGTGGNINKLFDLAKLKAGKPLTLKKIKSIVKQLSIYSYEERQNHLQLNADRADVIIPASEIYTAVMEWSGAINILVPNVGLKDGLLLHIYHKNLKQ